jgi:hypothetical protein
MEFQMKKVYYNTQLVLVFLIIARVIADSFLGFLSEEKLSIDILERVKHYTSPMIMLLMLYFMSHFETGLKIPENTENLSKFKKFMLHTKYGAMLPFFISLNLIINNILTDTIIIPILFFINLALITILLFIQSFIFRIKD